MLFVRVLFFALVSTLSLQVGAQAVGGRPHGLIRPYKRQNLQDIVTWDSSSIFIHGQRVLWYSGEFHNFRLPVPSLWLDIFQKIKALGYSGVSFYANWALLEGQQGNFTAEGIFDFEPFFAAASEAGVYLLARPGPYINAEVSGGGFPGWLQRTKAVLRTPAYLNYTENYVKNIGSIIAKAQITNGGPVILVQPENEYSQATNDTLFPDRLYFKSVEDQLRSAGVVVPFISNDAAPRGYFAPGNGTIGAVDIYGHDSYPLGFDCANPTIWPQGLLPTNFRTLHLQQSPITPYSLVEFQGGSFDPWGGSGFAKCTTLLNEQFERVFYKNDFSFGVTIFNIYMTYGGTNWGNLGHPGGYTSYDYGAVIAEDRTVTREKYSEAKLEANFLRASPAYLTAVPMNGSNGSYVNTDLIATTPVISNLTGFYVVRHAYYNSTESTNYRLTVPTSKGSVSIPQLSPALTLNGRDSKIHITDYGVGEYNLLYSSAEIFTWKSYGPETILVLYGGHNETHEAAFVTSGIASIVEGSGVEVQPQSGYLIINWPVTSARKVVEIGQNLLVYLLDRNEAYDYWVLDLPNISHILNFTDPSNAAVVVKAGYLVRAATIDGQTLSLTGDINKTTTIEAIGVPSSVSALSFNGQTVASTRNSYGVLVGNVTFNAPAFTLPNLTDLTWKYVDSLPEIQPTYDDSAWTSADFTLTGNPRNLTTPTSLYGSDYGFYAGNLLFRGRFVATSAESTLMLRLLGGLAFGYSVWLNETFLGSWPGISIDQDYNQTLTLPSLSAGQSGILTVLQDQMGFDEDFTVGTDQMKIPRGILSYSLSGHQPSDITWKITGNLGGESYVDKTRGPLNEGGLYAERQGWHLPKPPSNGWSVAKPTEGLNSAGVRFYTTAFDLNMPAGYDIPLSFQFTNNTVDGSAVPNYRAQLYVNGYQFGKYVNNIGPQTSFPVPEGILDYHGINYLALSLWALDAVGAKLEDLQLVSTATIQSGYKKIELSPLPAYEPRAGAY